MFFGAGSPPGPAYDLLAEMNPIPLDKWGDNGTGEQWRDVNNGAARPSHVFLRAAHGILTNFAGYF